MALLTLALNREIWQTSRVGGWDTAPKWAPGAYVLQKSASPYAQKEVYLSHDMPNLA